MSTYPGFWQDNFVTLALLVLPLLVGLAFAEHYDRDKEGYGWRRRHWLKFLTSRSPR